jgi:hypothetical protein
MKRPASLAGNDRSRPGATERRLVNTIHLNKGHFTPAGLWWATGHDLDDPDIRALIRKGRPPHLGGASIGDAVENKILDHMVANATYTAPTPSLGLVDVGAD